MFCRDCGCECSENAVACTSCGVSPKNGSKFCNSCGSTSNDNAIICVKCGCSLAKENSSNPTFGSSNVKFNLMYLILFVLDFGIVVDPCKSEY